MFNSHFDIQFTVVKSVHSLHSVPTFQSFHTLETFPLRKSKTPPNPCAYLHRSSAVQSLPISVFHLRSTRSRLACSSRTSFHKLHSFRKPPAVRRAALLHAAALKAVLPCLLYCQLVNCITLKHVKLAFFF